MESSLLTPKVTIFFAGVLLLLMWWLSNSNPIEKNMPDTNFEKTESVVDEVPIKKVEGTKKLIINEGVYFNSTNGHVSINIQHMPRLLIVQQLAEAANFNFSLPDQDIDYWAEPITVSIQEQPITNALSTVIGNKEFTLEMSYNSAQAAHNVSAVFLAKEMLRTDQHSPLGKDQPLPVEKNITEAPAVNVNTPVEQQSKRDNFFAADDQTRIAILQGMSPVGDDLRYIVSSLRHDKNPQIRALAAQRLSFSENFGATQSLIDALSDKDSTVVQMAVESLVSLGDASVISAMESKLGAAENGKTILRDASARIQSRFSIAADSTH
ncbi:MAG: hypothetical protein B0W54_19030 [Cellvibrio sp. 79]|nr:MAG: hypothetical protein B0W54_19030 [Cellvibrio sp. 79]